MRPQVWQSCRPLCARQSKTGADKLYRAKMGDRFIDYMIKMKMSEVNRFETYLKENKGANSDDVTDWEQREYFRLF